MTDNDLKRLEEELGFKLPTAYGNLMRAFPAELRDALAGTKYAEYVIDDVDKVLGWNPKSADSPGAYADKDIVEPYRQLFFREHPVYTEAGLAMLGGWSIDLDDDWLKWSKKPLVVLTVADSEPWVEVFDDGRKLVGFGRIT